MKVSSLLCVTQPEKRQDPWRESISSVLPWSDEVIIVCGHKDDKELISSFFKSKINKFKFIYYKFPKDFSFEELPLHLNRGLEQCKSDWCIRFDSDYIFEDDMIKNFKDHLLSFKKQRKMAVLFQKRSSLPGNRFYSKSEIQLGINIDFKNIVFGQHKDKYTDLCMPIVWDGLTYSGRVPVGNTISRENSGRVGNYVYNFDYFFKTKEFTAKEYYRFSVAHKKYFGFSKWGNSEEESFNKFLQMMRGRSKREGVYKLDIKKLPCFIQEKIKNITFEQFGHSGWGLI